MKSLTNRVFLPCGFGVFAIALMVAAMLGHSPPSLAIDGILTDCRVRGVIAGGPSPNPALIGEEIVTQLSAEYDQPKAATECIITGPTWSWTIKKAERKAQNASNWTAHIYRPTLQHPNPNSPDATLRAIFPQPGSWRVTLDVTASWSSTNCLGCSPAPSATVVVEATVSACTFTGVLTPEDDFMGRSYSRVGLGEDGTLSARAAAGVDLDLLKPLSWRVKSGSEFITVTDSGAGDGTSTFIAKRTPGRAVLELVTSRVTCRATLTVDVVAPNDVYHKWSENRPGSGVAGGMVTFGIFNRVHLRPTDVSFHRLRAGEGTDYIPDTSGVYAPPTPQDPHRDWGTTALTRGNREFGSRWTEFDNCSSRSIPENAVAGYFIWEIPQEYVDDDARRQLIRGLEQRFDFDGKRTIQIRKGGEDRSGP